MYTLCTYSTDILINIFLLCDSYNKSYMYYNQSLRHDLYEYNDIFLIGIFFICTHTKCKNANACKKKHTRVHDCAQENAYTCEIKTVN